MREKGTVVAIEDQWAVITLQAHSKCARCGLCKPGDGGVVSRVPRSDLDIGHTVLVAVEGTRPWKSIVLLQVLPLVLLVVGTGVGGLAWGVRGWWPLATVALAFGAAAVYVVLIRLLAPSVRSPSARHLVVVDSWSQ